MRDHRELLRLHLATLFAQDGEGRMTVTNEPVGRPAPRLFLGRTDAGNVWRFRHDVPRDVADALQRLCARASASLDPEQWNPAPFLAVLGEHRPVESVWHGPAYRFAPDLPESVCVVAVTEGSASVLQPRFGDWLDAVGECQPFFACVKSWDNAASVAVARKLGLVQYATTFHVT